MLKNLPANAGDADLLTRSGRFPGAGNGKPLQYSCLENLTNTEALGAIVHGMAKRQTQLSD